MATAEMKPTGAEFTFRVSVVVQPDEGGFHAQSPLLKGLHTDGRTQHEAVQNFFAELPAYVESLVKHGDPLPIAKSEPEFLRLNPNVTAASFKAIWRRVANMMAERG